MAVLSGHIHRRGVANFCTYKKNLLFAGYTYGANPIGVCAQQFSNDSIKYSFHFVVGFIKSFKFRRNIQETKY